MKIIDKMAFLRNAVGTWSYFKDCFKLDIDFEEFMKNYNSYLKANSLGITAYTLRLINDERAKQNKRKKENKK